MNKKHWNTVEIAGGIPEAELRKMIDHSYELVVAGFVEGGAGETLPLKPGKGAFPLRRSPAVRLRGRRGESCRADR